MKRVAVLGIGVSLIVFAGCMGKPVEQLVDPTEITPPTENKDIESFFNYLEETIKKEEDADQQMIADAELEQQADTAPVINDPNFEAGSGATE